MTRIFNHHLKSEFPIAVRGDGIVIYDAAGKAYIDGSCGPAVSCLGHSNKPMIDAIKAQLDKISYAVYSAFSNEPAEKLADELTAAARDRLKAPFSHVFFVSSGSEAVEAAIKLARQYFFERGETERKWIVARRQSYHGNTLGALSAGYNPARRKPYEPVLLENVRHIAPCYAYRDRLPAETEEAYGRRVADELEQAIREIGPGKVAAFICEPVVGATLGAAPAVPGYLRRIREICDAHGVLLILDEIMCGMGRTGYLFACEEDGVAPDLLVLAKGLGAGYQPVSALLIRETIADTIRDGAGYFQHGHTYAANPVACAAGRAALKQIADPALLARVRALGKYLHDALTERFGNHRHVGDIRGRGLFLALELVADRASKRPFAPDTMMWAKVKAEAMRRGLMIYPMGGIIDGVHGDHVMVMPPFIATERDLDEIVARLGAAVDAAVA